ncbi:hypothetical protein ALNOE001_02310 [Candidatus Methanobinarius endosymbioticus]|uniref:Uncharacterized protein n=1 Tax=Candidatus Methanobinarius endosymbioticus TaxID=2006182 RepID=A0A366ME52_9EURY|nr:hypothetical protein ALNOE001_02310 [Candidatus Methanobinarius endosymbioticus]
MLIIANILLCVSTVSTIGNNNIFGNFGQSGNDDLFLKEANVGGINFHIPDGYSLKSSNNGSYMSTDLYMKDSSSISFIVNFKTPIFFRST